MLHGHALLAQTLCHETSFVGVVAYVPKMKPLIQFVDGLFNFDQIDSPGAYVCNWSGHLVRVPEDAVCPGRSPALEILGKEDLHVTRISENPFIALTKARMVASDLDLNVNF